MVIRKLLFVLLSAVVALSADALGDTQSAAPRAKATKAKKCLFPKSKKRAPDWVCSARADGLTVTAVGSAPKSRAGISFMEQMAATDARVHLARDMRRSVQDKIRHSAPDVKDGGDGALMTEITNESLSGTRVVKSAYGPDGTLYVLVGLDEAGAKKLVDSVAAEYLAQTRK